MKNGSIIINIFILTIFLISNNIFAEETGIDFINIPKYREYNQNSVYFDVLSRSIQNPHGNQDGRYTNVHETAHGIHNELRNKYKKLLQKKVNAFYCLNGKAILIEDPNITISDIKEYIPINLRSKRFKLYLIDQIKYWDDTPTYILDEWNCYILGGECAIDDSLNNLDLEKTDAVSGCLEFSIYSIALSMAVKNKDNVYWSNNKKFKEFIKFNLIRAEKTFSSGLGIEEFHNIEQLRLYNSLIYDDESKQIRDFIMEEFDGIFIN